MRLLKDRRGCTSVASHGGDRGLSMTDDFKSRFPVLFAEISQSPRLYLHRISWIAEKAYLIEADRNFFDRMSFLDKRALSNTTNGMWVPLEELRSQVMDERTAAPRPCHFIFHVGHCGSTLISRLLGLLPTVLAIREPLTLRGLADAYRMLESPESLVSPAQTLADLTLVHRLLARTYDAEQTAIVKTTSSSSNLGPPLLALESGGRALLLSMGLEPYLANIMSHLGDVRAFAPMRLRSLAAHLSDHDIRLYDLSFGELAALSWIAELVNLHVIAANTENERVLGVDFDAFLQQPGHWMTKICRHFRQPAGENVVTKLLGSDAFSSYSKAPGTRYGAHDRARKLQESWQKNGAAIAAGLSFASRLAADHGLVGEAIERFGYGRAGKA